MKKLVLAACAALFILVASSPAMRAAGPVDYTAEDSVRIEVAICKLKPMAVSGVKMPEMLIACAKNFLGTPYVAGTLEKEPERLVVNSRETDCILFVEMCLATCLTARDGGGFAEYCDNVRNLRYRNGTVDGYASRLHYTSEWIRQAQGRGVLREVTAEIGGKPYPQTFSFMSTHPEAYKQLASGTSAAKTALECIREAERLLSADKYYLLRKADAAAHLAQVKDGDIVCFNTSIAGLDIAHVALAYHQDGKLTFIHASSTEHKVVVNKSPLAEYLASRKSLNGLRLLRVVD